ncbi:hypothetical protein [Aporhodopirellula aestuarii]|uniref:Uncharacterized protein n=1 Tax=Aporhodopirellula aestuarii TaxID=2950107 RepID=A0ABT0TY61_9BACT|nr:hypothetical protein [Aporhodopirellula aestuarii]MCM2369416.1 hypothetical protein [Aporhodopirellula aestuarii]
MNGKLTLFVIAAISFVAVDNLFVNGIIVGDANGTQVTAHQPSGLIADLPRLTLTALADDEASQPSQAITDEDIPAALQSDFKPSDIAAATAWADHLNLADWLGPLAPLALSPFFGVACLSGLALWGPASITENGLLGPTGPLHSVPLFVIFALLALLTSLPRLSKVSKPFAQAMDRVEAYAVVIILLAIKLSANYAGDTSGMDGIESIMNDDSPTALVGGQVVFQAGILSFTAETLLMIAMAINVLVINSVKFFFEFLVWLTPFPTVDAIFEVCNKAICAGLMAIYAFSPTLATAINLFALLIALIIFRWTARRVKFYRTMLLDPVLARLWRSYALPGANGLIVFPQDSIGPFPAKSCLRLTCDDSKWSLVPASSWSPLSWMPIPGGGGRQAVVLCDKTPPRLVRGWLTHTVEVRLADDEPNTSRRWTLKTSRRHDQHFNILVGTLRLEMDDETSEKENKIEFA